jgi:hypothetical protein
MSFERRGELGASAAAGHGLKGSAFHRMRLPAAPSLIDQHNTVVGFRLRATAGLVGYNLVIDGGRPPSDRSRNAGLDPQDA